MGDYSLADPDKRIKITRIATQRRRPISVMGRKIKGKNKTSNQVEDSMCERKGTSLSNKYEPRVFQEIVGHSIVVKTLSNAVQKKKIAPLYLFHGPNGTGKTSTARVFAMALNCESTTTTTKPCCRCKGCSNTMDLLCSANGFEKILIHNTSLAQAVVIIEECHLLTADAWEELMSLVEAAGPYAYVFLLLTTDANSITANISSRCQKFYFNKLNHEDVAEKLSRILVHECMEMEREALKLIVAKSQGSLRDAENILDQLALLGTTINTSVVQQLVGLIPESKLLELLAVAVPGDTINTIRYAKKLLSEESCVEPASFVSQLANLITNILSDSSSSLSKTQSARLCYILKLLVKTERQLRTSNDKTSCIIAAFLDITSVKASTRIPHSNEIILRESEEKSCRGLSNIWKDVLKGIESSHTQRFLQDQAKLASLCISRSNATIHLTFTTQQDKMAAEISEESLAKALEVAIGCPVILHFNLSDPNRNIAEGLRLIKSKSCSTSQPPKRRDLNLKSMFENPTSEYNLPTKHPEKTNFAQAGDSKNRPRHRWLSLSSIPQSDASVEPYSQDVIYENSNKDNGDDTMRKFHTKTSKDRRAADQLQSNPALCSIDICC